MVGDRAYVGGRPRSRVFLATVVVTLLLLVIVVQFLRVGVPRGSSGIVSPGGVVYFEGDDLPGDARGFFKGDEFRGARSSYVRNLKRYAELTDWVAASDPSTVREHLLRSISGRGPVQPAVPASTLESLAQHWAAVLCWCAGTIEVGRYLELLPLGPPPWGLTTADAADPLFEGTWREACADQPAADPAMECMTADGSAVSRFLESMRSFQPMRDRVGWFSSDPRRGVRVALWRGPGEPGSLDRDLSPLDLEYWFGQLAQGAVVVTSGKEVVGEAAEPGTLRARLMVIVRTQSGDAYPVHVTSRFLDQESTWVIESASRRSSIRAANLPSLAL